MSRRARKPRIESRRMVLRVSGSVGGMVVAIVVIWVVS
jgi:hypothetical protein